MRSLENKIRELEEGRGAHSEISQAKPEAIIRALQVLEVREQLERANNEPSDSLVREMYNKVLKKLEDSSHDN